MATDGRPDDAQGGQLCLPARAGATRPGRSQTGDPADPHGTGDRPDRGERFQRVAVANDP